jgi:hypothetical protein
VKAVPANHPSIAQARAKGLIPDDAGKPARRARGATISTPTGEDRIRLEIAVPGLVPVSKANRRDHWAVVKRREDGYVSMLRNALDRVFVTQWRFPLVVTFHRVGMKTLDTDNLSSSYKAIRDALAGWLGVDDGSECVGWRYTQAVGKRSELRTVVTIEEVRG